MSPEPTPAPAAPLARIPRFAWDFLALAGPRRVVRERPPAVNASVRAWWLAAQARLRVARQLDPEGELLPALTLYREGMTALIGAAVTSVEGTVAAADVAGVDAAWAALERIWPRLRVRADLRELGAARRALCDRAPLDDPPPGRAAAAAACAEMARLADLLSGTVEPRTPRCLAALAAARTAGAAAIAAAAIAIPVARWLAPRDLALNEPVTLSSVLPSRADVGGAYLVNGKLEYSVGGATDNNNGEGRPDPWMMIDLGRPTRIGKIAVYNRGDRDFKDCLPLILEVGDDPSAMKVLGVRRDLFTRTEPWVVSHLRETARYVRVRKTGKGYIALTEIEVYAP